MIDTIRVDYKQEITKENKEKISKHLVKSNDLMEKNRNLVLKVNRNSTSSLNEFLNIKKLWIVFYFLLTSQDYQRQGQLS